MWMATIWRSNADMYVTVPYNKALFSVLYFFTSQLEVDFGILWKTPLSLNNWIGWYEEQRDKNTTPTSRMIWSWLINQRKSSKNRYKHLTHLCLTFNYRNSSDVEVFYFLLRKVIAKSDISHMWLPPEGMCYHVVHRVSHCCRYWRAGSLSKKLCEFSENFWTIQRQVNTTLQHYILY